MDTTNNQPVGPKIGLIIILLIIIAGGIYFWQSRTNATPPNNENKNGSETNTVNQGKSSESLSATTSLESDLQINGGTKIK